MHWSRVDFASFEKSSALMGLSTSCDLEAAIVKVMKEMASSADIVTVRSLIRRPSNILAANVVGATTSDASEGVSDRRTSMMLEMLEDQCTG